MNEGSENLPPDHGVGIIYEIFVALQILSRKQVNHMKITIKYELAHEITKINRVLQVGVTLNHGIHLPHILRKYLRDEVLGGRGGTKLC